MKKTMMLALAAALMTVPVVASANDHEKPAAHAAAPMEMKDGSWAKVDDHGKVWVSKDGGKTWAAAPDGTWEMKDGSKVMTKGGMKQ
jgi:hypothetical protein